MRAAGKGIWTGIGHEVKALNGMSYIGTVPNCAGTKPSLSAIALIWSVSSAAARAVSKSLVSVKRFAATLKNWLKIIVKSAKILRR